MQIYIHRDDQEYGPYSEDQIRGFLADRNVAGEDYCRVEGDYEWSPLKDRLGELFPGTVPGTSLPPESNHPEPNTEAPPVDEKRFALTVSPDVEATLTFWGEIADPPLIDGASASATSKIMMGIESMRREDYEKALNLFHASLEESHSVASGWLGMAYAEAYLASIDRKTVENIRHAVNKAHEFCPAKQKKISDHHGMILTFALGQAAVMTGFSYNEHLASLHSAQQGLAAQQRAANKRAAAIAVGSVAAVLGGRSKGSIGKMIGYGIAANQTFRATEAHGVANQSRVRAEESLSQSRDAHEVAIAFSALVADLIKEARDIYFECNPKVRGIIDDRINDMSSNLTKIENVVTEVHAPPLHEPKRQSPAGGCWLAVIIFFFAILGFFVLGLVSFMNSP